MKITAFIVDDEPKAIATLKSKIERYCPQIAVVGSCQNPKEAKAAIIASQAQLVFLDIAMPEMSGFELLKTFDDPSFEIIFATAFDTFAIEAIRHCAIGYLVKPIDSDDLVNAVNKAAENLHEKTALKKNRLLIDNLKVKKFQDRKVIVPTQDGLEFIEIKNIIHCEGTDGYTKINIVNSKPLLSSNSIGHFAKLLTNQEFYLVHKSHLINLHFIEKYLNEGYVTVLGNNIPVSRNRRTEFLNMLKDV